MPTPLFKRIDTVFLPVANLQHAIDWYTGSLGFELLWQIPGVACLKVGETPLTLLQYRFPGYESLPEDDFVFQPFPTVAFNFYASNIHAVHQALRDRGVHTTEIIDHGDVKEFEFKDPDDNRIGVCWWPENDA